METTFAYIHAVPSWQCQVGTANLPGLFKSHPPLGSQNVCCLFQAVMSPKSRVHDFAT